MWKSTSFERNERLESSNRVSALLENVSWVMTEKLGAVPDWTFALKNLSETRILVLAWNSEFCHEIIDVTELLSYKNLI